MYRKISNSWLKHYDFIILDIIMLQVAYIFPVLCEMDGEIHITILYI